MQNWAINLFTALHWTAPPDGRRSPSAASPHSSARPLGLFQPPLLFSRSSLNSKKKIIKMATLPEALRQLPWQLGADNTSRVAVWLHKVEPSPLYSPVVKKGVLHSSTGIRFQIPTAEGNRWVSLSGIWPVISSATLWPGVTGRRDGLMSGRFLQSLMWNRKPVPGGHHERRSRYALPSKLQGRDSFQGTTSQ